MQHHMERGLAPVDESLCLRIEAHAIHPCVEVYAVVGYEAQHNHDGVFCCVESLRFVVQRVSRCVT